MNLIDFMHQYEAKIEKMQLVENQEDFYCKNGMPHLVVKCGILMHVASEYTIKIFSYFEKEARGILVVKYTEVGNDDKEYIYESREGYEKVFIMRFVFMLL